MEDPKAPPNATQMTRPRRRSAPDGSGTPRHRNVVAHPAVPAAPNLSHQQQNLPWDDNARASDCQDSAANDSTTRRSSSKSQGPSIFEKYKVLKRIGNGQFGEVFAVKARHQGTAADAHHHQSSETAATEKAKDNLYACKVINIATSTSHRSEDDTLLEEVFQEIGVMLESSHPNVQDLVDFSVENDKVYIVSSLCRGGDLAQALELRGCLCEEDAKAVMAGILRGLSYLHSRGIVHRDIKLENILLSKSSHDMSNVKIIDMGFAKKLSGSKATCDEVFNTVCGTPLYIAPELVRPRRKAGTRQVVARFGTPADMWSCGVVLYGLLSGCLPFHADDGKANIKELFEDIANAAYDFSDPVWSMVSDEALSLIEGLLEVDPSKRLTAEEALRHPWMASC